MPECGEPGRSQTVEHHDHTQQVSEPNPFEAPQTAAPTVTAMA